jgi:hypothetical protein
MIGKNMAWLIVVVLWVHPLGLGRPGDKGGKVQEIVDRAVDSYGGLGTLVLLRQTGQYRGFVKLYTGSDNPREGEITIRFMRRLKTVDDLKRIDLRLPASPAFTIAYDGSRVWGSEEGAPVRPDPQL